MVAKDRRLQWYAELCISQNLTEALENLVDMTRDLYGCDRDNIHFFLLQLYSKPGGRAGFCCPVQGLLLDFIEMSW